jgi:hypothetical protein
MGNAFYYSREHLPLKDNPNLIGLDLDWYLTQYQRVYKYIPLIERPSFSAFIIAALIQDR